MKTFQNRSSKSKNAIKIFESATEFILNLLAKTNRRFTKYEIHQRLVNTTFLDSGTLRDGKLIENGPTGTEMQQNITQTNVGQGNGEKMSHVILLHLLEQT